MKKLFKPVAMVMACVILFTSVFSSSSIKANAAVAPAIPVVTDKVLEIALFLYGVYESALIVSSADKAIDEYEESMDAFEAFGAFAEAYADKDFSLFTGTKVVDTDGIEFTFDYQNGQLVLVGSDGTVTPMDSVWGTSAKKLIDEDTFENFRVLEGGSGDAGGDPEGGDDNDPFTHLEKVSIGTGFLGVLGDFVTSLFNGETELNPAVYYTASDVMYTGSVPQDVNGYYIYLGAVGPRYTNGTGSFSINYKSGTTFCGYIDNGSLRFGNLINGYIDSVNVLENTMSGISLREDTWYNLNFPVFASDDDALLYSQTGDASTAINAPIYDFPDMAESVPEVLHPLTGINFSPDNIFGINGALSSAADSLPEADPAKKIENTDNYKNTMIAALAENMPEEIPDTEPAPEPEVDPDNGAVVYTGILNKILSAIQSIASGIWSFFQNPMKAITDGIENLNNGLLRIIEILPNQLEQVLGNIVLLPQAIFDLFANPLQGIQEALNGLWANIEPYLEEFLDALRALLPVPAFDFGLDPDVPGGGDGSGSGSDSGSESGFKFTMLLDGLIILILILLMLLSIFLHCLEFIINVFKIPATPGFLPEDMVIGFDYIKTLEIPGIGMSVYDFLMGLVYILLVFGVIGVLRKNIDRIRLDR